MADPITWRSVMGPSLADAARPMESAASLFNAAFDPLQTVLKGREATELGNFKQMKENNTNTFLNQLYATKTPEEMAALQSSGKLQAMLDNFGAQIDQAKAREAMDTRLGTLQSQTENTIKYNDAVRNDKDAPIMGEARARILRGDFKGAEPFLAQMSAQNRGLVMGEYDKHKDDLVVRSQRDEKAAADLKHLTAQEENWRATAESGRIQANAATISANAAAKNAATGEADMLLRRRSADEERLSKLTQQKLALTSTIATPEGSKMVMDEITKMVPEGRDRLMMLEAFGKMATDPTYKDLTPAAALQAIAASVDSGRSWRKALYNGTGDSLSTNMTAALTTPDQLKYVAGRESAVKVLDQQIEQHRRSLYPELYKNVPAAPVPGASPNPTAPTNANAAAAAPANPWAPPPSSIPASLQAELATQKQEIAAGLRKGFTPEVQSAIDADRTALSKFNEQVDKRRIQVSKQLGIAIPAKPGTETPSWMLAFGGPEAILQAEADNQARYQAWAKAIDRRIAQEESRKK